VASFRTLVDVTLDDDASCLENEVTRRHLLEAAVLLKCSLTRPIKKRDSKAYSGMRTFMTSPHALKAEELVNIPVQEVIELQRWNVHIFNTNHLSASTKDPKPTDVLILYSKKSSGRVQMGVPFDLKFKQWDQPEMKKLRWYENGKMYSGLRYGKRIVDLMCDENKGILFYCPIREVYSWKKAIDASYYDVLSDTHGKSDARNLLSRKPKVELDGATTESTEENAAKANRIIKAHTRAYRSVAIMERRSHNVWADLDMTKPANRGVSVVMEESESGSRRKTGKKPTHASPKATKHDPLPKEDSKFKMNRFRELINQVLVSSYIRPSYTPPTDSSGPRITAFDEPDQDALEFEDELTTAQYIEYADHIFDLLDHPEHVPSLLSFCECLMKKNLGREVVMVLVRVLEVSVDKTFPTAEDFAVVVILTVRLYCKYMSDFRIVHVLIECAELCPESALVLSLVGRIFHALRLHTQAEELYVGALLLNPMHPDGLRGYGILLAEKGNYNAASRYLSRVDESSTMYHMAKLEFAWTLEILGNRDDAMLLAYQAVLQNGHKNRATSLTLASMGHFFHVRGDLVRAMDFYSRCMTHCPSNAFGFLMDACAHASTLTREAPTTLITTFSTLKGSKTRPDDFLVVDQVKGVIHRPGLNSRISINKDDEEIDAKFRRGLFYLKGTNRWLPNDIQSC
jgi:tetratricopeptide (TPR) repeat protein